MKITSKQKSLVKQILELLPDKIKVIDIVGIYCCLGFQIGMILSSLDYLPLYNDVVRMYKEENKVGLFIIIQSYQLMNNNFSTTK